MNLSARVRGVPISATVSLSDTAAAMRARGADVIDLSAGRASEATPRWIVEAATEALRDGDVHQTMARGTPRLRAAAAAKLARDNAIEADPERNIVATTGCKNGLTLALIALIDQGDEVLLEDPGFVSYAPTIRYLGGVPIPVPLRRELGFRWSSDDLRSRVTRRTRAIVFCSPHNPTGVVHSPDDLEVIAAVAREHDLAVIADEVYERVTWGDHRHTCISTLPGMRERTVDLMSLTKSHAMGGWRIGFAHGPAGVVDAMVQAQGHLQTCAGSFTQAGASFAFEHGADAALEEMWADWERRCEFVAGELGAIDGVSCSPPAGGFYAWADVSSITDDTTRLAELLLGDHGVAIVPGAAFGPTGEGFIRVTCVKSWDLVRDGVERLRRGLESVKPS